MSPSPTTTARSARFSASSTRCPLSGGAPLAGRLQYGRAMVTEDYFGEGIAASYDESLGEMSDPRAIAQVVDVLAALAGDGRALELGIGTGRIALPLASRGIPVHGIDMSQAMVAKLRAKPGGESVGVTVGD